MHDITMFTRLAGTLLFFTIIFGVSCTKKEDIPNVAAVIPQSEGAEEIPTETPQASKKIELKKDEITQEQGDQPENNNTNIMEQLFAKNREIRFIPEDFRIGMLQDNFVTNRTVLASLMTINRFLSSFTGGEIERKLLYPPKRPQLIRTITYQIEKGYAATETRVGILNFESGTAYAKIRFFSPSGTAEGEIYLTEEKGTWFISDIQIAFQQNHQSSQKEESQFFPDAFRNQLNLW